MSVINKRIESLDVEVQPIARTWMHVVNDILKIDARFHETLRDRIRQGELEASGASKNKVGWHNFGRAWDFGVYINGIYQRDDRSGLYLKCGFIGMALGCRWGGNWDMDKNIGEGNENDLGHLEFHPGLTIDQMVIA